jgi:hypothetical protein
VAKRGQHIQRGPTCGLHHTTEEERAELQLDQARVLTSIACDHFEAEICPRRDNIIKALYFASHCSHDECFAIDSAVNNTSGLFLACQTSRKKKKKKKKKDFINYVDVLHFAKQSVGNDERKQNKQTRAHAEPTEQNNRMLPEAAPATF